MHETPIAFTLYSATDAEEMENLLGEMFARHEPPTLVRGITPGEFAAFVRLLCPKVESERLTIVARSAETGEMLGVLLAEDASAAQLEEMDRLGEKFAPIFDILAELDAEYRHGREVRPGECVHLFLLGVAARASGKGIARQLAIEALANAGMRGYRVAITEATGRASQHVFRKLAFVERARRSYADYRYRGEAVFASIAEQGGPILMERQVSIVAPGSS